MLPNMRRITHSCGHEQDHYIIGEYAADYDRQAARLSRGKCNLCRTQAAALIAAETSKAVVELGLAALQGSPKQIAWAETIRAKRISELGRSGSAAVMIVSRITDAKWWIERRSDGNDHIITSASTYLSTTIQDC